MVYMVPIDQMHNITPVVQFSACSSILATTDDTSKASLIYSMRILWIM